MSDMWQSDGPDPRVESNPQGEKATYVDYLDSYRHTLRLTCEGLVPEQLAARSVPPSALSLVGLVRHLASVEHHWFARVARATGEDRLYRKGGDRDHAFTAAVGTQECADDAFATWEREVAAAQEWLGRWPEADLGVEVPIPDAGGAVVSIRDLLVHMVEEYAWHCGHADLLRECIDGRTGQ